jgi:hypothetical protein
MIQLFAMTTGSYRDTHKKRLKVNAVSLSGIVSCQRESHPRLELVSGKWAGTMDPVEKQRLQGI